MLPRISNYGNYSSSNYGAHTLEVRFDNLTLYYSYQTVIAFYTPQTGFKISENIWGNTTGKHLNWLDHDHTKRINHADFNALLNKTLEEMGLAYEAA